jgi:enoyl-CoA hydratase/carnithine racemase
MSEESGRAQDQGRRHRRKGAPGAETLSLLARYQSAMRAELASILDALEAVKSGLMTDVPPAPVIPLDDERRTRLWDRAVKLARELGTAVDPPGDPTAAPAMPPGPPRRRGRPDFG